MKNDKRKIKEPFEPDKTPKPPQIIEPNSGREREKPVVDENRTKTEPAKQSPQKDVKPHLLSDEADISDETTI